MLFIGNIKEFNKKSGIYKITCLVNNKIYVGSTCDFNRRFNAHRNLLKNNKHYAIYMQNAYNLYGKNFRSLVMGSRKTYAGYTSTTYIAPHIKYKQ